MAIDTRDKRGSIIGIGLVVLLPLANGTIDQGDRQQTAHTYVGIVSDLPVIIETGNIVDRIYAALDAFDGTINDRMYADLGAKGFTGAMSDRLDEAGGYQAYIDSIL